MSNPESDPNEQANISGADFAIMCDEIKALQSELATARLIIEEARAILENCTGGGYAGDTRILWDSKRHELLDRLGAAMADTTGTNMIDCFNGDAPMPAPVPAAQMDNPDVMARATAYARDIVTWLHRDHYADNTRFEPFDDLLGLLSQIDNMVCGWKELSVAAICNAYESGVGHRGRPTANVNPYREGTPEHEAYAIGAGGTDSCRHGIRYPHPCRECEESVPGSISVCEACRGHGCSQCENGFVMLAAKAKVRRLNALPVPAAQAEAKVADDVGGDEWSAVVRELMAVASYRPACQKYVLERCRCFECVNERAVGLLSRNAAMLAAKARARSNSRQ